MAPKLHHFLMTVFIHLTVPTGIFPTGAFSLLERDGGGGAGGGGTDGL